MQAHSVNMPNKPDGSRLEWRYDCDGGCGAHLGGGMEKIVPFHLIPGCEEIDSFTEVEEGDLIVLAELCGIGSDLSKARRCFHYFCFPSDEGARHAASDLAAMDFEALIGGYLQSEPETRRWPVRAERTEVVNAEIIRALRGPLSELAERNGGTYDGWAASAD